MNRKKLALVILLELDHCDIMVQFEITKAKRNWDTLKLWNPTYTILEVNTASKQFSDGFFGQKWPRNKLFQFLAGLYCSHCICICILFSFGQLPSTVVYLYLCMYLDACICIFIIYISFSVACWQSCFVSFLWRPRLNWDFSTIAGNKIYGHLDL